MVVEEVLTHISLDFLSFLHSKFLQFTQIVIRLGYVTLIVSTVQLLYGNLKDRNY